ncbi:MAG: hypothetical protein Q7S21_06770 [archaeon]|nr:hypothetical protein [archaeon]
MDNLVSIVFQNTSDLMESIKNEAIKQNIVYGTFMQASGEIKNFKLISRDLKPVQEIADPCFFESVGGRILKTGNNKFDVKFYVVLAKKSEPKSKFYGQLKSAELNKPVEIKIFLNNVSKIIV